MEDRESPSEDRFARVAEGYDRWIGWGPRLEKELPFLLQSLPNPAGTPSAAAVPARWRVLDVGCGTGAHAIALASAGYLVTGVDRSVSMLEKAHRAEAARALGDSRGPGAAAGPAAATPTPVEWLEADVTDPAALKGRRFDGVLALGNVLLSLGEETAVLRGLESMVRLVAPGGSLVLQYLNGARIRAGGRLVIKSSAEPEEIWLRHHFEAGGELYFHSYVLRREGGAWTAEPTTERVLDLPAERTRAMLRPHFDEVEIYDGLTGRAFDPARSDAVGVRARGRR